MGADDNIRKSPDGHDKWRHEEPGIPDWEEYMGSDIVHAMKGEDHQFSYLSITMLESYVASLPYIDDPTEDEESVYIASDDYVELEDKK